MRSEFLFIGYGLTHVKPENRRWAVYEGGNLCVCVKVLTALSAPCLVWKPSRYSARRTVIGYGHIPHVSFVLLADVGQSNCSVLTTLLCICGMHVASDTNANTSPAVPSFNLGESEFCSTVVRVCLHVVAVSMMTLTLAARISKATRRRREASSDPSEGVL